jgi:hypothetical protein
LARHSVKCKGEIEWEKAEVIAMEKGLRQRKAREGIESLREQQSAETDFYIFVRGEGWINIWGGAAACFGRGVVATPGKAKEKV